MLDGRLFLPAAVIITLFVLKRLIRMNRLNVSEGENDDGEQTEISRKKLNLLEGVEMYEVFHPLLIWTLQRYAQVLGADKKCPKVIILILKRVWMVDETALTFISEFYRRCHRQKIKLIIVGLNARFTDVLKQADVFNCVCDGNIVENIDEAMDLSKKLLLG